MVAYVIEQGWLDGRLKARRHPTAPATPESRLVRTQEAIARWERKRKRAETALQKLRRRARRYERLLNTVAVA